MFKSKITKWEVILLIAFVSYIAFFCHISILKHLSFETTAFDLALFDQSLWFTLKGKLLYSTLNGFSFLGDHFSPILLTIIPFYAIFQSPIFLLVLQTILLASGSVLVFIIARKELRNEKLSVTFACVYLLYPALHGINLFDFHAVSFAPVLLLLCYYLFDKKDYRLLFPVFVLCLFIKEDTALTLFALSLFFLFSQRKREWKVPLIFSLVSIIWLYSTLFVAIPLFNPEGQYMYFHRVSLGQLALNTEQKLGYLSALLSPLLFLPLLSSVSLIALPSFLINLLSTNPMQYSINWHYNAYIIPFLFVACIKASKRMLVFNKAVPFWILSLVLFWSLYASPSPIALSQTLPTITLHDVALHRVITFIPPDASISTHNDIFPHISHRENAYLNFKEGVEYVLFDTKSPWYNLPLVPRLQLQKAFTIPSEIVPDILDDYGVIFAIDGIWLLKKDYDGKIKMLENFDYGLIAKYYDNKELKGDPIFVEQVLKVDIDWVKCSPFPIVQSDYFSSLFEGNILIPETGNYTFRLKSDDGSRLYIDGILVLDGWKDEVFDGETTIWLEMGTYPIKVEHKEISGYSAVWLFWKTPLNEKYKKIPENYFFLGEYGKHNNSLL